MNFTSSVRTTAMAIALSTFVAGTMHAQTAVTSRSQLTNPFTIDWNTIAPPLGSYPDPLVLDLGFTTATFTVSSAFPLPINCPAGSCWPGGFSPGDGTYFGDGIGSDAITITFSSLITGFATQAWFVDNGGGFMTFVASRGGVGTFSTVVGLGGGDAVGNQNQAPVFGVLDPNGIDRIDFLACCGPGGNQFAINQVDIENGLGTVPEPASIVLVTTGLAALALGARRRRVRIATRQ